jgi:lipopolysaccharide export system protein LptA
MKHFVLAIIITFFMPLNLLADDTPIEVTADQALEWNRAQKTFTATGNAMVKQDDTSITAEKIEANYTDTNNQTQITAITATPNPVVVRPNERLTAKNIVAAFKNGQLDTITANNDVVLTTDQETLFGDKAVYNALERTIIVTGDVRIEQGENILTGNKAHFDLKTRISTLTATDPQNGTTGGRVKATFFAKGAQ